MSDRIDDALSRGFDAGNYASAYVSEDLDLAREVEESEVDGSRTDFAGDREAVRAFDAAFTIGFFGSCENHEVPGEHLDALLDAEAEYGPRMRVLGICADPRHPFVPLGEGDDHAQLLADVGVSWMSPRSDRDFCAHRGSSGHRDCGMPREDHPQEDEEDC